MKTAAAQAVKEIQMMKSSAVVMNFVTAEAYKTIHFEMTAAGSSVTLKGVEILTFGNSELGIAIRAKRDALINAGLIGCLMAKYAA